MITYNRYVDRQDHVWYDSSNIVYSKCYDTGDTKFKTLKVVFKGGRTYLYRNVDADDYLMFKTAESNGQEFNKRIKKYDAVRIEDTDMDMLDAMRKKFMKDEKDDGEQKVGDLTYVIRVVEETGEFAVVLGDRILFRGKEGNFSILNLLTSLNIKHILERVDDIPDTIDENKDKIDILL